MTGTRASRLARGGLRIPPSGRRHSRVPLARLHATRESQLSSASLSDAGTFNSILAGEVVQHPTPVRDLRVTATPHV